MPSSRPHRLASTAVLLIAALSGGRGVAQLAPLTGKLVPPSTQDANTPTANAVVLISTGCTGTLIREDLVLTAGHCFPPSFDGAGVPPGVWQRVRTWYPSDDWTVSFGNDRNDPILTARVSHFASSRLNDLALLALERPVSPTVAIPIPPLLSHAPIDWTTQAFTLVGWGAIDAIPSYPRYRQRTTASNGRFPCPNATATVNEMCVVNGAPRIRGGDSGGPLLWTDRAGKRFVIGEVQNAGEFYVTFGPGNPPTQGSILSFLTTKMAEPNPNAFLARNCLTGNRPGATLLYPYFEVDLANPLGASTLLSIQNRSAQRAQVHVVMWTDWGKPTFAYDLTLEALALQTINLRDTFQTGHAPQASAFGSCSNPTVTPATLRASHLGTPLASGCLAQPRADQLATGYVTVDTVLAGYCPIASDSNPWDPGYFQENRYRRATDQNVLAGDFFLVSANDNFAQGFEAVALVAEPTRFRSGEPTFTFWGKYVDYSGLDHRAPLPDSWSVRYGEGGGFSAGTQLLIWRETPTQDELNQPEACGSRPDWLPLGERALAQRSEAGVAGAPYAHPNFFPLATQKVAAAALTPSAPFGSFMLDLGRADGTSAQAWAGFVLSASGRFSVGQSGTPTHDLCDPLGFVIGNPGGPVAAEEEVEE